MRAVNKKQKVKKNRNLKKKKNENVNERFGTVSSRQTEKKCFGTVWNEKNNENLGLGLGPVWHVGTRPAKSACYKVG